MDFPQERPFVIAGPCSAESRSQVLEAAAAVKAAGVRYFRAGLWKPRTHPGGFEGLGAEGLPLLADVRRLYGLSVCTEVASAAHVKACLDAGVDMVWIGARTSGNPFLVQEIADTLSGADIPVLVKNPISPDAGLWAGAIERLRLSGVSKVGAVLRGCPVPGGEKYRNQPYWSLSIELRTRFQDIPILADPSHMAGDRAYVRELSQRALDLGLDGLMIESHPEPEKALSDASQQLSPQQLRELLEGLSLPAATSADGDYLQAMDRLRARIDLIDENLLALLRERSDASIAIGRYKKEHGVSILQPGRWETVLGNMLERADALGLSRELIKEVMNAIHADSVRLQER